MDKEDWKPAARKARQAIDRAFDAANAEQAVTRLTEAGQAVEKALAEAMAAAVLKGSSMRRLAELTGLAPNSVPPRLARSQQLRPYATAEGISAKEIAVARYDAATGRPPMSFTPRRKEGTK
jgi:lambda repressor-like predicted transcriptional regulator